MGDRFCILAKASDSARAMVRQRTESARAWTVVHNAPGLIVVAEFGASIIPLDEAGLIIGALYTGGRRDRLTTLRRDAIDTILASRGDHLIRAYWGNYVAILRGADAATHIVRSPLGSLPALYAATAAGSLIASDVRLLERFGDLRLEVDWARLARFAAAPDVRLPETCLAGIDELPGGNRLTLRALDDETTALWSPWTFAHPDRAIHDPVEARKRLHDTIVPAMATVADRVEKAAILLSGGLDSSIVAASAAANAIDATCVTISTSAASGDERPFARAAADGVGLPLAERSFDLAGVDLTSSDAGDCPRPVAQAFEVEGRRQSKTVARSIGATTIFSGGGGDNVFCSLQSVAAAADCLDDPSGRTAFWRTARNLSQLTGVSLWTIARRAWTRSRQRDRQYPRPFDPQFLSLAAIDIASTAPVHPWLIREHPVLQGKGAHVAALLGVQCLTEGTDPLDPLALRFPLLVQPVVEMCLRIPTWLWYDRGNNRAAARHAFAKQLPPEIAWRRSKGTPDSFVIDIYDGRRDQIRAMLLDGAMAAHGLLDKGALRRIIDDRAPVRGTDHNRVMRLVDIEAWTRCWPT